MVGYSLEKSRKQISDLGKEVKTKEERIEALETSKEQVLEARTEIEGANISEEAKEIIVTALIENEKQLSEQAKEISDDIGKNLNEIESVMEKTQEAGDSTENELENLNSRKSLLDRINAGGIMEKSINTLENDSRQINNLKDTIIETRKEAEDLVRRASLL